MSLADLELHVGDRVRAAGALLVDEDGAWLQRDVIVPAVAAGPGQASPLHHLPQAVPVRGDIAADWHPLVATGLAGFVEVVGRWDGEGLELVVMRAAESGPHRPQQVLEPPCLPPEGGWPQRLDPLPSIPDALPGLVGAWMAWASTDHPVMIVATSQPDLAEQWLRADFEGSLCIVSSPWSGEEIERVTLAMHLGVVAPLVLQVGTTLGSDGRVRLEVDVVRVTPELVDVVNRAPAGLMEVRPWLLKAHA